MQASFQNEFLGTTGEPDQDKEDCHLASTVKQLTCIDSKAAKAGSLASAQELITGLGVHIEPKFYAAQNVASEAPYVDSPTERAKSSEFSAQVQTQIDRLDLGKRRLTAEHVFNRMGAMTCAGCHQFSNGREIAPNIRWPMSLRFVHIDELGCLSDLLRNWFLPARAKITSNVASGNSPHALSTTSADVLEKSNALCELLETSRLQGAHSLKSRSFEN